MGEKRRVRLVRRQKGKTYITADGLNLVREAAAGGLSKASIAARLGLGASTFRDLLKRDERAQAAFDEGLAANENELVSLLMQEARGDGPKANTARIFLLKTRHNYREVGPATDERQPPVNIVIPPPMSAEELERFIQNRRRPVIEHGDTDRTD